MSDRDLVIKNGTVATAGDTFACAIADAAVPLGVLSPELAPKRNFDADL